MFLVITSKRHRISQTININHQQSCDRNHHMFVEPFFMNHQVRLKHKKESQNHNIWFVDGLLIVNHKTQSTNILKTININHQQITKPSTLRWRCFQELMGVHRHLVPGNSNRYGTRDLVPLNSIEFVGYIVISDMMFYDFIGICFLILGGKPIGFYLQEHRLYFFCLFFVWLFLILFVLSFLGVCYLEMVLEEYYVILGFFVFVRWFEMSAITLAYENAV